MRSFKRITVFTGHYGSGKTEIAINYAVRLKEVTQKEVFLVDMDIVNPFFRSADAADRLKARGVRLIASPFAGSALENPALPPEINTVFENKDCLAVFDVGGGEDGAVPLGRYRRRFEAEDYDMFFVLNERRPATHTAVLAAAEFEELELASRLKYTGIVNNTHLKARTSFENITDGYALAKELSGRFDVPVCCSCAAREFVGAMPEGFEGALCPIDIYLSTAGICPKERI